MFYTEQDLKQHKIRKETGVGVLQRTRLAAVQDKTGVGVLQRTRLEAAQDKKGDRCWCLTKNKTCSSTR